MIGGSDLSNHRSGANRARHSYRVDFGEWIINYYICRKDFLTLNPNAEMI